MGYTGISSSRGDIAMETILMTTKEAAEYLRRPALQLKVWRGKKIGPYFVKIRGRVYYTKAQLDEYIANCVVGGWNERQAG